MSKSLLTTYLVRHACARVFSEPSKQCCRYKGLGVTESKDWGSRERYGGMSWAGGGGERKMKRQRKTFSTVCNEWASKNSVGDIETGKCCSKFLLEIESFEQYMVRGWGMFLQLEYNIIRTDLLRRPTGGTRRLLCECVSLCVFVCVYVCAYERVC